MDTVTFCSCPDTQVVQITVASLWPGYAVERRVTIRIYNVDRWVTNIVSSSTLSLLFKCLLQGYNTTWNSSAVVFLWFSFQHPIIFWISRAWIVIVSIYFVSLEQGFIQGVGNGGYPPPKQHVPPPQRMRLHNSIILYYIYMTDVLIMKLRNQTVT